MPDVNLNARLRSKDKKNKDKDIIPAVVYGPKSKNQNLEINYGEFSKIYEQAGESTLVDLIVEEKNPIKVLIHDIQYNPVSDKFVHIDFYQLDMNKKIKVEVELAFSGIEEVEKATGAEVVKNIDKLEVECLPKDLIKEIEIKVNEKLKNIGDAIHAKDIKLPDGLNLAIVPETLIINLQEIKEEIIEQPKEEEKAEEGEKGEEGKEEGGEKDEAGEKKEDKEEEKAGEKAGKKEEKK